MKENPLYSYLNAANKMNASVPVKITFPFPLRGYNYGYLTGRTVELLHEISLPSGDFVYLYAYEYNIDSPESDMGKNLTFYE